MVQSESANRPHSVKCFPSLGLAICPEEHVEPGSWNSQDLIAVQHVVLSPCADFTSACHANSTKRRAVHQSFVSQGAPLEDALLLLMTAKFRAPCLSIHSIRSRPRPHNPPIRTDKTLLRKMAEAPKYLAACTRSKSYSGRLAWWSAFDIQAFPRDLLNCVLRRADLTSTTFPFHRIAVFQREI